MEFPYPMVRKELMPVEQKKGPPLCTIPLCNSNIYAADEGKIPFGHALNSITPLSFSTLKKSML
ncbi:hypothetical protein SLEP1_g41415 [Rubroshorea leprosula]|uniref:Uncharacterized protein n=1 Tax=Rubroshorea leprosula TaxID=152421 RepID=A0AAV5L6G2_9ROSI|nr:hypothetical protein SLEP1_g41415 [Rubroshorea leprosula]